MLIELSVRDFAIIENIQLNLASGFNVITGETGAGKSILLKSLSLLMGEKGSSDLIRNGKDTATIEGAFDIELRPDIQSKLTSLEIPFEDDLMIVRRVLSRTAKGKVYINSTLCSLHDLRELISPLVQIAGQHEPLIELTGQFDSKNLLNKSYHLELVDAFGQLSSSRREFEEAYQALKSLEGELQDYEQKQKEASQRSEFLRFQIDSIEQVNPEIGELDDLLAKISRLKNSAKIAAFCQSVVDTLYDNESSLNAMITELVSMGSHLPHKDPEIETAIASLEQILVLADDTTHELRKYSNQFGMSEESLEALSQRLSALKKLVNRFGGSVESALQELESMREELRSIENLDELLLATKKNLLKQTDLTQSLALKLHRLRVDSALKLEKEVARELKDLNMKGSIFKISTELLEKITPSGLTHVEFGIQSGSKSPTLAISRAASGGELSRILLSLKTVISQSEAPRTFLFDEVDTGVSGPTAQKVGRKLKSISESHQVVSVTHLPQVASLANHHVVISKELNSGQKIKMTVSVLSSKERALEIARLISGDKITDSSLKHAQELIQDSAF